jgi:hypothetical protein
MAFMAGVGGEGNIIRVDLPETMGTPGRQVTFAPVLGIPSLCWGVKERGVWQYEAEVPAVRVKGTLGFEEEAVAMSLSVTNRLAEPLSDLGAQICLQLAAAPMFRDLTREHVFFFSEGKPVRFADLEKRDGYWSLRAVVKGQARRPEDQPGPHPGWMANVSKVVADDGVICVTSPDGAWTLGTLWERARHVFNNPGAGLACIHSDPVFPEIAPGETATVRGWIMIVKGSPEEARAKLLARLGQ